MRCSGSLARNGSQPLGDAWRVNVLPDSVIHADWSVAPPNRWFTLAQRQADGSYLIGAPGLVGDVSGLLDLPNGQRRLLGLDVTIGIPRAYAQRAGIAHFVAWLSEHDSPPWERLREIARSTDQISTFRPFYPARPGGASHQQLVDGLGMASINDLRRACERCPPLARPASPLFWTLGAAQVGRASLSAWREVVAPARVAGAAVWPYDGSLLSLVDSRPLVIAEAYPAEMGAHLGIAVGAKRDRNERARCAPALLAAAARVGAELTAAACADVAGGFANDHAFDAFVGVLGMLNVLRGNRPADPPADVPEARSVEGWILGVG